MIKVYKPGEKRKSLSECGCAAQCAEVTSCVRGTPVRVVVTHAGCESPNSSSEAPSCCKGRRGPHAVRRHELRVSSRES
jgi:hypothetical protein